MIELSGDQKLAADAILQWWHDPYEPLTLGGYAGTGKTTLLGELQRLLGSRVRIVFTSFTGKAVSVLRSKLPPGSACSTLHRLLYRPRQKWVCVESGEDALAFGSLEDDIYYCYSHHPQTKPENEGRDPCEKKATLDWTPVMSPLDGIDLVVVDEASMLSEKLWADLTKWGVPVLAVGDHGQLPPVRSEFNLMANPQLRLEKILRQAEGSPIIRMATLARTTGHIPLGDYGPGCVKLPRFKQMAAVRHLNPENGDLTLCSFNKTRNSMNTHLRRRLLGPVPDDPVIGDIVICLRNSYEAGVFNGMRGQVAFLGPEVELYPDTPQRFANIELFDEDDDFSGEIACGQFNQPKTLNGVRRSLGLWDYGYAMTVHKCVDDATRILTQRGWQSRSDLKLRDQVLTLNMVTGLSEWQPIVRIHEYSVTDEELLSIEVEGHSSLTTMNHRWPVRKYRGQLGFVTSQYLFDNGRYRGIPTAAEYGQFPLEPKYSDAFVELVAWYWTEGSIGDGTTVSIAQSNRANPDNVNRIRKALRTEFGEPYVKRLGGYGSRNENPSWRETDTEHPKHFRLNVVAADLLRKVSANKRVRPEFLLALTQAQLELFIEVSLLGDGHLSLVNGQVYGSISQKDKLALEAFQLALMLSGYSTNVQPNHQGGWHTRLKKQVTLHQRTEQWCSGTTVMKYTGTVWCPEVENGTWLAERNGTVYFTGNSQGSQADRVLVIEEPFPREDDAFHARLLYTAVTRASRSLCIVGPA